MEAINACIISFYMDNINPLAVTEQRKVVDKFNKSKYPFYQIKTNTRHGWSMDAAWHMNGVEVQEQMKQQITQKYAHDVILFLDIDALPLNDDAIDTYVKQASDGFIVGNVQRSNHIENGQHLFVAPSAMAISESTFLTIGKPSAIETRRSDVGEEYTWKVEEKLGNHYVKLYFPLKFEGKPFAPPGHPEVAQWNLKDGQSGYGLQSTFGLCDAVTFEPTYTFWHNFQSFYPGQHEKFMAKCAELLKDENVNSVTV